MSNAITTSQPSPLISFIERAARDPEFDIAKFSELLRMQREVERDQNRRAFNRAMSACQSEMMPVVRDARNDHLKNKYAKLETIDSAIRPIYTRHGFSVRYGSAVSGSEGMVRIVCTIAHDDGYWEENYLDAPSGNAGSQGGKTQTTGVQAVGSVTTYLRRYLLAMCFNVVLADDDDDGEGSRSNRMPQQQPAPMPALQAAPPVDPISAIRDRLSKCETASDVMKVSDGWLKTVAKRAADGKPVPELIASNVKDLIADAYGAKLDAEVEEGAAHEPEAVEREPALIDDEIRF